MPCEVISIPGGGHAIIRRSRRPNCQFCKRNEHTKLCDFKIKVGDVGHTRTCDAKMCNERRSRAGLLPQPQVASGPNFGVEEEGNMARLNDLGQGKLEAPKIDPREVIIRKGFNYRDTTSPQAQAHIAWLKQSIAERGVDDPIWVEYTDGKVYLIDGECRLLALRALWNAGNEVRVPAIAFRGDEAAVLAKSMISNGALPPSQLEFGNAAERLANWGWSVERIAALTPPHLGLKGSKAKQYVKDAIELHQAPLDVKKAVAEGIDGVQVSPALALSATRRGRLMAPEVLKDAAARAKAKGKKVATRPKGAGKVTKAAEAKKLDTQKLLEIGDRMAEVIQSDNLPNSTRDVTLGGLARKWQRARG